MEAVGELKVVRMHRFESDSKVKAFADVALGDFVIKGFKVVQGANGLFLSMPQEKSKDGKWYDSFFAVTKQAKEELSELVLGAYRQ